MDFKQAFYSGTIAGLATSLARGVGRSAGITSLNVELLLGSMLTQDLSPLSGAIGFALYLLIAGGIACLYAVGFAHVMQRASWAVGLLFALVHLGLAGLFMDALGDLHPLLVRPPLPLLDGHLLAPGLFAANFGTTTMIGFFVLHFMYGGIIGAMYQKAPVRRLLPAVA